jgi:hypothetical protein
MNDCIDVPLRTFPLHRMSIPQYLKATQASPKMKLTTMEQRSVHKRRTLP